MAEAKIVNPSIQHFLTRGETFWPDNQVFDQCLHFTDFKNAALSSIYIKSLGRRMRFYHAKSGHQTASSFSQSHSPAPPLGAPPGWV